MAFQPLQTFPDSHPGPYELQMGRCISTLLQLFAAYVPDTESNSRVAELAATPNRWSAGHAYFDEVRRRRLSVPDGALSAAQYSVEECCCKAMYNASEELAPFDSSSPFFVVPMALGLAIKLNLPLEKVVEAILRTR